MPSDDSRPTRIQQRMPDPEIGEVAKPDQTRPTRKSGSSLKRKPEASGDGSRKKRAMSGRQSAPLLLKRKLSSVPSDPKKIRAFRFPSMFRNNPHLPAYTLDGEVRYGVVEPSDEYLKFYDKAPAKKDPNVANRRTPRTPQASSSYTQGRVIRPTRSVKNQFGFSPLTTISERSETTSLMRPAKNEPPMRVPSRLFDRMNANKRKRWTSPESIPNPKGNSSGFGGVEFYGNAEEDEIAGQQPGKVRRMSHLQNFGSQGTTNSVLSRPCIGSNPASQRRLYQSQTRRAHLKCRRPAIVTGATARARMKDPLRRPRRHHPPLPILGQPPSHKYAPMPTNIGLRGLCQLLPRSFHGLR